MDMEAEWRHLAGKQPMKVDALLLFPILGERRPRHFADSGLVTNLKRKDKKESSDN